jgi:hypothetical protein
MEILVEFVVVVFGMGVGLGTARLVLEGILTLTFGGRS